MNRKDFNLTIFIFINFLVYLILSIIMNRSLFVSENDGFFYQIMAVSSGSDLGVLSVIHQIRYIVVYPLIKLENFSLSSLQPLFFFFYVLPLFIIKTPRHVKFFSLLLLYFSLFFSYRTIIVMISVYILVLHIKYNVLSKKLILLSFFYSLLSSGVFLFWFLLIYTYKEKFIKNKYILKYSFFLFLIAIPSLSHKILFFIDPLQFGSARDVSLSAIFNISSSNIEMLFSNILERSMLNEAYVTKNLIRLSILTFTSVIFLFLFVVLRNRFLYVLFMLYLVSLLFEGLMAYSLFFSILFISYDYLFRNSVRLLVVKKNTN